MTKIKNLNINAENVHFFDLYCKVIIHFIKLQD